MNQGSEQTVQLTVENSTKEQRLEAEIRNLQAKIDNLTKTKKAKEKALSQLRQRNQKQVSISTQNQQLLEQNLALQAQIAQMMEAMAKAGIPVEQSPVNPNPSQENSEPQSVNLESEENSSESRETEEEPIQVSDQPSQQDQEE